MKLVNTNKTKRLAVGLSILMITLVIKTQAQVWTLDQCVDTAMVNNKKLKIGKNDQQLVIEKQKEVKSNLLPKITANGDYKYYIDLPTQLMPLSVFGGPEGMYKEAQFGVPHNINANLQLAMPLYSPKIYGGIEASKIASEVSELQYQKTEEAIAFDIANYYYNAQIIKSQIAFLDSNEINSKRLLQNITLLKEQLLVSEMEVDKVALQVKQIATKKSILNSKYLQVLNGIKLLMGVDQNIVLEIDPTIVKPSEKNYPLQSSLDSKLLDAKFSLLSSELSTLKKSRFLPSAFLYGSYGAIGYGQDAQPNQFLNFYNMGFVGVKLSVPIFNGTVTNKKINQKKLELENATLRKELIVDQNQTMITNAKLQKEVAQATIVESEWQIELAQSIYNKTLIQQKEDLANLTDVLLADNALREAQQNYISSIIDYLKADLELKKLTGNMKKTK